MRFEIWEEENMEEGNRKGGIYTMKGKDDTEDDEEVTSTKNFLE